MPIADPDRQSGISKQTYFEVQIDFSRLANQATRGSLRHSTARSRTMPEPALVRIDVGRETRQYSLRLRPKVYERSCTNTRHCPRIRSGSVMPVSGMVHLQPRGGTSSEEATINPNSLEVPLHLPQIHTSQTGQIKNKKPAKPCAIAGFCILRTGMDRYLVPGTGLEPASQLRRRIFVTLLLSKPTSSERHRSCAGLCLRRRARACCVPVRLRRPPSSLYTFLAVPARLGSALPRCAHQGFRRI